MPCLFCQIVEGKIPAKIAYKDDEIVAFHDIDPKAPTHVLVIPRKHIANLNEVGEADDALVGRLVRRAKDIAREQGLAGRGYRLNFNCGDDAGYSVHHIHLHLLGGRTFGWPPG